MTLSCFTKEEANIENAKESGGSVHCWFCALVLGLAFYLPRFCQEHFQFAQIPSHCVTFKTLKVEAFQEYLNLILHCKITMLSVLLK